MVFFIDNVKDNKFTYNNVECILFDLIRAGTITEDDKDKVLRLYRVVKITDKYAEKDNLKSIMGQFRYNPFKERDLWICDCLLMIWSLDYHWAKDYINLIDYVLFTLS